MTSLEPLKRDLSPCFYRWVLGIIVLLCIARNLPWHLDDFDQAKQAYTSFEMVESGHWLFQHTPTGRIATKPPLAGWISSCLALLSGGHGWEFAWRLPGLVGALLILRTLWRSGSNLYRDSATSTTLSAGSAVTPEINLGGLLAVAAFGLNFFTPRLATLVRTDMMLATFIFFIGWLAMEKLRTGQPWTRLERWLTFTLVLASMLTKGPIAYGFLLPGMLAFWLITRHRSMHRHAWAGWWCWLAPLAFFAAWAVIGIGTSEEFKQQVVFKEFLGRFTVGENATHHNHWPGYYVVNLLGKAFPWSLLLAGLLGIKRIRRALLEDPALLWLTCWTFGGLLFMECVPSKRDDRIFPVIPPACLLLAALARYLPRIAWRPHLMKRLAMVCIAIGLPFWGGYAGWEVLKSFRDDARVLVHFGSEVRERVKGREQLLAVVNGKDEGMLLYTRQVHFTRLKDAIRAWQSGQIDWMVLGESDFLEKRIELEPFEALATAPKRPEKFNGYRLLKRLSASAKSELDKSKVDSPADTEP